MGHMIQAGTVDMFDTATSATPDWDFTLKVPPGSHALVAYDAATMVIQRNISTAATPSVDLTAAQR